LRTKIRRKTKKNDKKGGNEEHVMMGKRRGSGRETRSVV